MIYALKKFLLVQITKLSLKEKKILDIFKINKKHYLLDHFKGLKHYNSKNTLKSKLFKGKYVGKIEQIKDFINFFKFKNIQIINKDATKLFSGFFKKKYCLAYFDMDLYLPTIKGLRAIDENIIKGRYMVFDQGDKKLWSERKAIKDFLRENKKYQYIFIDKNKQPDVILKKIRTN